MEKPLINILTRTSNRPNGFKLCFDSIKNQTYDNIRHIVSVDDYATEAYVEEYTSDYIVVDKDSVRRKDLVKDPKTGGLAPHNLYLNELLKEVDEGYILFLDDDDMLIDENVIQKIVDNIIDEDTIVLWQMKYPSNINPVIPKLVDLGKKPILGKIGSPCFLFHSKYIGKASWDGWKCSDFRFISKLYRIIPNKVAIPEPLINVGQIGRGKRLDITQPIETTAPQPMKAKMEDYSMGVMLIAFGFDYDKMGVFCSKSIRKYSNIEIMVHTNIPDYLMDSGWGEIDNVTFVYHNMLDSENRIIKTQLNKFSKFNKTVYIDVDSEVLSGKFLEPFDDLGKFDIIAPKWKILDVNFLQKNINVSKKYVNFLKVFKMYGIRKHKLIGGGVCYFNKSVTASGFFGLFHQIWRDTGKKEDMPGLNGAYFKYVSKVKVLENNEYNGINSTVIKSLHDSTVKLDDSLVGFTRRRLSPITGEWGYTKQGSVDVFTKTKICFIYDVVGWAFYDIAHNLKKWLSTIYEIDIISYDEFLTINKSDYDVIISFTPSFFKKSVITPNMICGLSSDKDSRVFDYMRKFKVNFSNNKGLFERLKSDRTYYLPNGINYEFYNKSFLLKKLDKSEINIGCVGSQKWATHKGITRVKEICSSLQKLGYNVNNKSLFVDATGVIKSKSEMVEYYKTIDIFVVSSVSETGPNPLLESMASGIPVVSNRTGLAPELIEHGKSGFLVDDYNDIDSYVKYIAKLIDNTKLYEVMSMEVTNQVLDYDWSLMCLPFINMIDTLKIENEKNI